MKESMCTRVEDKQMKINSTETGMAITNIDEEKQTLLLQYADNWNGFIKEMGK